MAKRIALCFVVVLFLVIGLSMQADAQHRRDAPPPYAFREPPRVVVIPGTYIYAVPDIDQDIVFYRGAWYRFWDGNWYKASGGYNGEWVEMPRAAVPAPLMRLQPDFRNRIGRDYRRIPYNDLRRNWGRWEREHHWDRDRDWREGRRERSEERDERARFREEERRDFGPRERGERERERERFEGREGRGPEEGRR